MLSDVTLVASHEVPSPLEFSETDLLDEPKDPSLCFAIEKGGEKFVFASSSQEEMIRWLKVIRAKVGQSE